MSSAADRPAWIMSAATGFLCRFITYFWQAYRARAADRRSIEALRDLDPRLLADVGLTEADRRRGRPGS